MGIKLITGLLFIIHCTHGSKQKVDYMETIHNATHYWTFSNWKKGEAKDINGDNPAELHNSNQIETITEQLGNALRLDGDNDWVEIKGIIDSCISKLECPHGLSLGFWLNFNQGDYILAAGGYAGISTSPPGFRLKRDFATKLYKLEVATADKLWELYILHFPSNWFHLSFTWNRRDGLKLYFNGELQLSTNQPKILPHIKRNLKDNIVNTISVANSDVEREFPDYGKFEIAHLAIWKKSLSEKDIHKAYAANVIKTMKADVCCYEIEDDDSVKDRCGKYKYPDKWEKVKERLTKCICPEIKLGLNNDRCLSSDGRPANIPSIGRMRTGICRDYSTNCQLLARQSGFCNSEDGSKSCSSTCRHCFSTNVLAMTGPKKHFTQEALIFSTLGCIGGLTLLLGITVYFWKIYRTRYHGAFQPPSKVVSLLDVSHYDEEKWPSKYIDSSTYFIKDVPPKKRALPLITARTAQTNHRYQPPEFD